LIHLQFKFKQIGEQDGLFTLVAASTETNRSAEDVALRAAPFADQLLAALATLVHGVGYQCAT
jgi:hypothetical protein